MRRFRGDGLKCESELCTVHLRQSGRVRRWGQKYSNLIRKGFSTCDDATRIAGEVKAFAVVFDAVRDMKLSAKLLQSPMFELANLVRLDNLNPLLKIVTYAPTRFRVDLGNHLVVFTL